MFPIMLDLTNKKVVLVGGGKIAYHKVLNLQRFAVIPHVISPEFHPMLEHLEREGQAILHRKRATVHDLQDAFLIILVTNDEAVNDELAQLATAAGKLVVHASNPSLGNAQVPAALQRGKLTISVSTSGASPTLAKSIRNELGEQFDTSYEEYLEFLAECRKEIKARFTERAERRKWLQQAIAPQYRTDHSLRKQFLQSIVH